jgi:site-specific DNA-methyltransferase (adenine-specific)
MFPVVNEFCVQYVRKIVLNGLPFQQWMHDEWARTGLPFNDANKACGVTNAATRKYFAPDQWYAPPIDQLEKIITHANEHGDPSGIPYFAMNKDATMEGKTWPEIRDRVQSGWLEFKRANRAKFYCPMGVTNVWRLPPMHGRERVKLKNGENAHLNQKPLSLIKMLINASSDPGDVIWEPFGGLCPVASASIMLNRKCYSAELNDIYHDIAVKRARSIARQKTLPVDGKLFG